MRRVRRMSVRLQCRKGAWCGEWFCCIAGAEFFARTGVLSRKHRHPEGCLDRAVEQCAACGACQFARNAERARGAASGFAVSPEPAFSRELGSYPGNIGTKKAPISLCDGGLFQSREIVDADDREVEQCAACGACQFARNAERARGATSGFSVSPGLSFSCEPGSYPGNIGTKKAPTSLCDGGFFGADDRDRTGTGGLIPIGF